MEETSARLLAMTAHQKAHVTRGGGGGGGSIATPTPHPQLMATLFRLYFFLTLRSRRAPKEGKPWKRILNSNPTTEAKPQTELP
ncbi:hypothetical protein HID58_053927 [Brassica napus]|uniref:Uncharacterized protein n=1 Tax=Brassica napus TaxID=3708 RepID=A0ABQ8AGC0_BRANA|nr:hypothetical protein HID58_053927 [Brassica napus]